MNHHGLVRHSILLNQHLNKETVTTKSVPAVAKRGADRSEEEEQGFLLGFFFAMSWIKSQ